MDGFIDTQMDITGAEESWMTTKQGKTCSPA